MISDNGSGFIDLKTARMRAHNREAELDRMAREERRLESAAPTAAFIDSFVSMVADSHSPEEARQGVIDQPLSAGAEGVRTYSAVLCNQPEASRVMFEGELKYYTPERATPETVTVSRTANPDVTYYTAEVGGKAFRFSRDASNGAYELTAGNSEGPVPHVPTELGYLFADQAHGQ